MYFADHYTSILSKNPFMNHIGNWVDTFLSQKTLIKIWCGLLLCWLPYMIINYPATFHWDSGRMLVNYISGNLNNHDPIVQTLFLGSFITNVASTTGSYNLGAFMFSFVQYLYCSFIFACFYRYLYKKGCPSQIFAIFYIITAIAPMFTRNSATICKDSNYSIFVLLFVMLIMMFDDCAKTQYAKLAPLIFISMLLTMFARRNGPHLVFITAVFFLIYLYSKRTRDKFLIMLITAILALGCFSVTEMMLTQHYGLYDHDVQESSSIFFQQTARYVRDYKDEIPEDERNAINAVLDYDAIAGKYNPKISDPVKATFRPGSTAEDYKNYLRAWFKGLCKHPGCYLQATLNNIYGYFYPDDYGSYPDLFFESKPRTDIISAPEGLAELAEKLRQNDCDSRFIPIIGLVSSVGFYTWMDIFMSCLFLYKKKYNLFISNIPALVTLLICIASPVNNTVRYALPMIFMVPFIICAYFSEKTTQST